MNAQPVSFTNPYSAEEAEIERRQRELRERHRVTFDRVRDEIARIAFSNVLDYATVGDGELVFKFDDIDAATAAAIGEVTVETYMEGRGDEAREVKRVRVKPWSKLAALDQLMRHAGLSKDKTNAALLDVAARLTAGLKRIGKKEEKDDEP